MRPSTTDTLSLRILRVVQGACVFGGEEKAYMCVSTYSICMENSYIVINDEITHFKYNCSKENGFFNHINIIIIAD